MYHLTESNLKAIHKGEYFAAYVMGPKQNGEREPIRTVFTGIALNVPTWLFNNGSILALTDDSRCSLAVCSNGSVHLLDAMYANEVDCWRDIVSAARTTYEGVKEDAFAKEARLMRAIHRLAEAERSAGVPHSLKPSERAQANSMVACMETDVDA